jgi:hypothetical protein
MLNVMEPQSALCQELLGIFVFRPRLFNHLCIGEFRVISSTPAPPILILYEPAPAPPIIILYEPAPIPSTAAPVGLLHNVGFIAS